MSGSFNLGTATGLIRILYDGRGVDAAKVDLGKMEKGGAALTTALGGAGLAIAGALGIAVKSAVDFERQVSAIGAVSGASREDIESLRQKALQLGADTSFSATEAAQAMEELAKAGVSVNDILGGAADAAVALAAAGGVDLAQAASIAADAMAIFSLKAKDMTHVVDLFAGAANASSIDVTDLADSMKFVGPVAAAMGLSIDQVSTAIALMGKNGIKGSEAGTSLRAILTRLNPTSKEAANLMKKLGLITKSGANIFFDATGHLNSFESIVDTLNASLADLTPQQKQFALQTIFGTEALSGINSLLKEESAGFIAMGEAMGKVSAADVAAARLDNAAGSIEQLKGSIETFLILIGSELLPTIKKVANGVTGFVNVLTQMDPELRRTIVTVAAVVSGVLLLIGTLGALRAAIVAINIAALFNPVSLAIVAIALAIAGIGYAFKKAWDDSASFRNGVKDIADKVATLAKTIRDGFNFNIAPRLKEAFDVINDKLLPVIRRLQKEYGGAFKDTLAKVVSFLNDQVRPALDRLGDVIESTVIPAFRKLADWYKENEATIKPIIKAVGILAAILAVVATAIVGMAVVGPIVALGAAFAALVAGVQLAFIAIVTLVNKGKELWNFLSGLSVQMRDAFMAIPGVVSAAIASAIAWFTSLPARIGSAVASLGALLYNLAWAALTQFTGAIASGLGATIAFFRDFPENAKAFLEALWSWLQTRPAQALAAVRNAVSNFKTTALAALDSFGASAKGRVNETVSSIGSFFEGLPGRVGRSLSNLKDSALEKLRSMKDSAIQAGKDIVEGIGEGIDKAIKNVLGKVQALVDNIKNKFKQALDSHSPSKLMRDEVGRPIAQGVAVGIEYDLRKVVEAQESLMAALTGVGGNAANVRSAVSSSISGPSAGSPYGAGAATYHTQDIQVNVNAPQNMSPDEVGERTAARIALKLDTGV